MSHRCYKEVVFLISCRKKGSLKLKVHIESLGSESLPKIKTKLNYSACDITYSFKLIEWIHFTFT